jgi:hypothetical protein
MIKKEYNTFTASELDLPAFSGSIEDTGISMINARGYGRPVVRYNPACWDRSLPASTIQFMSLQYRTASKQELEQFNSRKWRSCRLRRAIL